MSLACFAVPVFLALCLSCRRCDELLPLLASTDAELVVDAKAGAAHLELLLFGGNTGEQIPLRT